MCTGASACAATALALSSLPGIVSVTPEYFNNLKKCVCVHAYVCLYVCMCVHIHVCACAIVCVLEVNFWELVLPLHLVDNRISLAFVVLCGQGSLALNFWAVLLSLPPTLPLGMLVLQIHAAAYIGFFEIGFPCIPVLKLTL